MNWAVLRSCCLQLFHTVDDEPGEVFCLFACAYWALTEKLCFLSPDFPTINALTYYSVDKNNNKIAIACWRFFKIRAPKAFCRLRVIFLAIYARHICATFVSISQYYTCNFLLLKQLSSSPIASILIRIFFFLII